MEPDIAPITVSDTIVTASVEPSGGIFGIEKENSANFAIMTPAVVFLYQQDNFKNRLHTELQLFATLIVERPIDSVSFAENTTNHADTKQKFLCCQYISRP